MTRADRQRIAERMLRDGYSHNEIAERVGVHIDTVRKYTLPMRRRETEERRRRGWKG